MLERYFPNPSPLSDDPAELRRWAELEFHRLQSALAGATDGDGEDTSGPVSSDTELASVAVFLSGLEFKVTAGAHGINRQPLVIVVDDGGNEVIVDINFGADLSITFRAVVNMTGLTAYLY